MNRLFYLSLAFIAISCSQTRKPIEIQQFDLSELIMDTLYLEKDTLTKELGSNFTFFETDSGQYLLTFLQHTLYQYSFPEGKIIKKTKFETEGPDGIGSFLSGYFLEDSLIHFISNNEWITASHKGKVIERNNLPEAPIDRLATNYTTYPFNKIYKTGDTYHISDVPFVLKESLLSYQDWILKFQPNNPKVEHVRFKFPKSYVGLMDDPNFGPYNHTFNTEKGEYIISLPATDSLMVISANSSQWIAAAPSEPMKFIRGTTEQVGEWTAFHPSAESSIYKWVHFEPSSKKTLRMSIVRKDLDELRNRGIKPLYKLIVLGAEMEKEAEITLLSPSSGFQLPTGFFFNLGYFGNENEVAFGRVDLLRINP
jgi:hypothetical protein